MYVHQKMATAVTLVTALFAATAAQAGEHYSFPSASGSLISASTPQFAPLPGSDISAGQLSTPGLDSHLAGTSSSAMDTSNIPRVSPPPAGSPNYRDRVDGYGGSADAAPYAFLTRALNSASYANYAADYYRLFAPGHAVASWTERAAGIVEVGYGAVDGWTAGTYYLNRLRGPAHRTESAPDLTLMPTFRPHPELEQNPSFSKHGN